MPISIGAQSRGEDVLDLLLDCHDRIRSFMALAKAVAERHDLGDADVVDACNRIARYFGEAAPLHAVDEERSLMPRLRGKDPELDAALERMCREHRAHEEGLRELLLLVESLREAPHDMSARAALRPVVESLGEEIEAHLEAEEAIVLPAVRSLLNERERNAIVAEIRQRRAQDAAGITR